MSQISYNKIVSDQPWILKENQKAILSSDCDGLICGLLMSSYFNWEIAGYYDSQILLLQEGISTKDCIFLDVEIFREYARSIGHHIIIFDINSRPTDFDQKIKNCINPNIIRKFDKLNCYTRKYPFGTLHFLLSIMKHTTIKLPQYKKDGIPIVLFIDGVWNSFVKYYDNVIDWIDYLDMENCLWWQTLKNYSEKELKFKMDSFLLELKEINQGKSWYAHIGLDPFQKELLFSFLEMCSRKLGWQFKENKWINEKLKPYKYNRKFTFMNSQENYDKMWQENLFSLSTYFKEKISYTLEEPIKLP